MELFTAFIPLTREIRRTMELGNQGVRQISEGRSQQQKQHVEIALCASLDFIALNPPIRKGRWVSKLSMAAIQVPKSSHERLLVSPWERRGEHYVSVSVQRLGCDGEYRYVKSIAVRSESARELAKALVDMAESVDELTVRRGGPTI